MKTFHFGTTLANILVSASTLLMPASYSHAQTKYYVTGGMSDMYYHNSANQDIPSLRYFYYGLEVDKYIGYHYAITTGIFSLQGGYDNSVSRWTNQFIQVPIGIKVASLGEQIGVSAGFNINYLLNSQLRELADQQNNYVTTDVTSAMQKIQPDFYFGLLFRLNRLTAQFKFSFSLTNRFSTDVKALTDANNVYYGSYYVYVIGKDEQKLTSWTTFLTLSYRVF